LSNIAKKPVSVQWGKSLFISLSTIYTQPIYSAVVWAIRGGETVGSPPNEPPSARCQAPFCEALGFFSGVFLFPAGLFGGESTKGFTTPHSPHYRAVYR